MSQWACVGVMECLAIGIIDIIVDKSTYVVVRYCHSDIAEVVVI